MNKLKYNDSKISFSSSKKLNLNNLKTQNPLYKNNKEEKIRKNAQIEDKKEIKNEEIVEKKDAFIVLNNEKNEEKKEDDDNTGNNNNGEINKNDINKEEINKNSYLKLTQEEINKLINNTKTKSQINENFFKNNINKNNKKENKTLKNLIEKQNNLFNDMDKIKLKKKYLNEYSWNNLSKNSILYKNIQKDTIKKLEQTENNIMEKITSINQQINDINNRDNEDNKKPEDKKEVKKEKKEKKVKTDEKYLPYQKIMKDAEIAMIKKGKEFDKYEKEKNLQKSLEIIDKIKKGKEFEKSRKNLIKLEVVKTRPFINSYNKRNKKNYLYIKMANSLEKKKEETKNNPKNNKNKNNNDDKKEFNLNDYLNKKKIESKENTNKLHKLWKERSNILSKYKSSSYFKVLYSDEGFKQREKNKKENIKKLYNNKEKYSKEKIHLPPISNLLKREREKEYVLIKKKNILKKNNSNLSNREFKKMPNKEKNLKEIKSYSSISISNSNKKNGIVNIYGHLNKKALKNPKDFNYLEEIRKERLINSENSTIDLISNNNKDIDISIIKGQIQLMEEKYKRDKELLKIQGGYAHNHELGDKMNQLLVNSIKNKLDMIENMNI